MYKPLADSTLQRMKKTAIIELLRIAEHNAKVAQEYVDQQAENIKDWAPVRHGRWIDNHCTACGMMPMGDEMWKNYDCEPPLFERFMDYCPSCGAKMQEVE